MHKINVETHSNHYFGTFIIHSFACMSVCIGVDCGTPHLLENGNVNFDNTTLNNTATYFCVEGYRQNGDTAQIQCQTDGTWSQRDIECVSGECVYTNSHINA